MMIQKKYILLSLLSCSSMHISKAFIETSAAKFLTVSVTGIALGVYRTLKKEKKAPETFDITTTETWRKKAFLRKPELVYQGLHAVGFEKKEVKTKDNHTIETFLYNTEKAEVIIIGAPGFRAGEAAGISSFFANIKELNQQKQHKFGLVLFNPRNRGGSTTTQGFFADFLSYSEKQYLDIVALVQNLKQKNPSAHIILHGLCAGGFHAMKALEYLQRTNDQAYQNVKGCIVDSSWTDFSTVVPTGIKSEAQKHLRSPYTKWLAPLVGGFINRIVYKPFIQKYHKKLPGIQSLACHENVRFLFIHWQGDNYAAYEPISKLASTAPNYDFWTIPCNCKTQHAAHNLYLSEEYQKHLETFIQKIEQQYSSTPNHNE